MAGLLSGVGDQTPVDSIITRPRATARGSNPSAPPRGAESPIVQATSAVAVSALPPFPTAPSLRPSKGEIWLPPPPLQVSKVAEPPQKRDFTPLIEAKDQGCKELNSQQILLLDCALRESHDGIIHLLLETKCFLPKALIPQDPLKLEQYYFNQLMEARKAKFIEEQILYLLKWGDLSIQKNELLQACKLLNSALALLQRHKKILLLEDFLFTLLAKVETLFYASKGVLFSSSLEPKRRMQKHREQLRVIREKCEKEFRAYRPIDVAMVFDEDFDHKSIREVQAILTNDFKNLFATIIGENIALCGQAPVKWACMALGSMSRGEMCPYSDIECAVLMEEDTETARAYFRTLFNLIAFQIVSLGETRFPLFESVDSSHPSVTPSGFSLDIGGNTPLGMQGVYELISTPEEMAEFLDLKWINQNIILSNALSNVSLIAGSDRLLTKYNQAKQRKLAETTSKGETLRRVLALRLLEGHLEEFKPELSKEKEKTAAFGIKKELYRPLQEILGCLTLWFELQAPSTQRRIEELVQIKVFSSKGAKNLKLALDKALSLRVEAHLFYRDEQEYLCHREAGKATDESLFYFEEHHVKTLAEIYRVLLPFHKSVKEFYLSKKSTAFEKEMFYDERAEARAAGFEKGGHYKEAQAASQQAVALNPNDIDALERLAQSEERLGHSKEALKHRERALELSKEKYGETHAIVARCYSCLGISLDSLGEARQALSGYKKALAIRLELYGEEHPDVAASYIDMGISLSSLGEIEQALEFEKKALDIRRRLHAKGQVDITDVASCYHSIGISLCKLGRVKEALEEYQQKALKIFLDKHKGEHPHVAACYYSIGNSLSSLGSPKMALEYLQKALKIWLKLYGELHPDVASCYDSLAEVLRRLVNPKQASEYQQKAKDIRTQLAK